jgi:hypothetical protein
MLLPDSLRQLLGPLGQGLLFAEHLLAGAEIFLAPPVIFLFHEQDAHLFYEAPLVLGHVLHSRLFLPTATLSWCLL